MVGPVWVKTKFTWTGDVLLLLVQFSLFWKDMETTVKYNRIIFTIGLVVTTFCLIIFIVGIILIKPTIERELLVRDTEKNIPEANKRYRRLITEIEQIDSSAVVLYESVGDLYVDDFYPTCIRAGGRIVLGSQTEHNTIGNMFIQFHEDKGWFTNSIEPNYTNDLKYRLYLFNNKLSFSFSLTHIEDYNNDYIKSKISNPNFMTIYVITYTYAEPKTSDCIG